VFDSFYINFRQTPQRFVQFAQNYVRTRKKPITMTVKRQKFRIMKIHNSGRICSETLHTDTAFYCYGRGLPSRQSVKLCKGYSRWIFTVVTSRCFRKSHRCD